jgi:hypothetical protein
VSITRTITCSLCGAQEVSGYCVPESCKQCGASSSHHVRWWNTVGMCLMPMREPTIVMARIPCELWP